MKKTIIALITIFSLGFVACGGSSSENKTVTDTATHNMSADSMQNMNNDSMHLSQDSMMKH